MYQYKHVDGQIINKADYPVDSMGASDYFDSPFVVAWWHINDKTGECDKRKENYLKYGINTLADTITSGSCPASVLKKGGS